MDSKRRAVIQAFSAFAAFLGGKPIYGQEPKSRNLSNEEATGAVSNIGLVPSAAVMRLYLGAEAGMIDKFEIISGNRKVTLTAAEIMDALEGK